VPVDALPEPAAAVGGDPGVLAAVRALPERLRVVVLLHYYADLPVADVAKALRRPVGSVKRQLNEARALLSHSLGDDHA
jgi:RNA polymerase sigma-70 factor (ECF subfamily)